MKPADFDFELPADLIAQEPPLERGASRLLVLERETGRVSDRSFQDLPDLLQPGDLLVVNDTRVFPARLLGRRLPGGGAVECLLVRRLEDAAAGAPGGTSKEIWEALVHPGQRLKEGSRLEFEVPGHPAVHGEVLARHYHGRRTVRLWTDGPPLQAVVDAIGHVPLPPYIKRPDVTSDRLRYQTVFADRRGSIAAPTAGLHFTAPLLDSLAARGIERTMITLHVGYGTFQPVRVDDIDDHRMETEWYEIPPEAARAVAAARAASRRIVAVGTTTTRALEWAAGGEHDVIEPGAGVTDLFIRPGHRFRVVSGLITNFHLPRSSLLMLVSAFAGRERVLKAYAHAVGERYRFYSYGDAMLVL